MSRLVAALLILTGLLHGPEVYAQDKLKVLLLDGQNNHNWQQTSPLLIKILESTGRFAVERATSPPKGEDLSNFQPRFADYDVVVSNYNGDLWSAATREALYRYVKGGGGFVVVHAANNAFPEWPAYNEMIAVGGWGGRDEKSGPMLRLREGEWIEDTSAGRGGTHGARIPVVVKVRQPEHPIVKGLPQEWMHPADEVYGKLRGPAKNVSILATAYSEPEQRGTGEHEPIMMTIDYGKGRVFHTTLGHDVTALQGTGFQITLQRGAEWAATGDVKQPVPKVKWNDHEPTVQEP